MATPVKTPETPQAPETLDGAGSEVRLPRLRLPAGVVSIVLVLCVPFAVAMTLLSMVFAGAFATGTALFDPGPIVDYGLPIARSIHDGAAAVTVGLLVLAATILPGQTKVPGEVGRSQWRAARWAAWSGAVWFVAAVVVLILTGAQTAGVTLTSPLLPSALFTFAFQIELGQSLVVSASAVLAATIVAFFARRLTSIGVAAGLGLFALLPLALSGHSAGSYEHGNAVDSLAVHLLGVTVWVGGLIGLLLLRRTVGTGFGVAVSRYSALAGWAFVAVAASGVVNTSLRLQSPEQLFTTQYGLLITAKASALILLGVAGVVQRSRIIPRLKADPMNRRLFIRLATTEAVFMAFAIGVAVGLSKSPPPVSQAPLDNAREGLLGFPFPPPVTVLRMVTVWHIEWMWLALAALLAIAYVWAFLKVRRRGDRWPVYRLVAWLLGCVALVWATSGGPSVYGFIHFSSHMIEHMVLMMYAPILFVLGGPTLLLLRALPTRHDGSRGVREWLLLFVHSRFLAVLAKPPVAGVLFAGSLVVFYYSPAFEASLTAHEWHTAMCLFFLFTGYLFFWVFIGIDPGPARPAYPMLFIVLLATLAFHAFFGVVLIQSTGVLAPDWWRELGETNTAALLNDQHTGGGIAWGGAEIPMVLVAIGVAIAWSRADDRTAKRLDRKADRDGDAELRAYNEQLSRLADRDKDT
jgi:putative copper resistance protein D